MSKIELLLKLSRYNLKAYQQQMLIVKNDINKKKSQIQQLKQEFKNEQVAINSSAMWQYWQGYSNANKNEQTKIHQAIIELEAVQNALQKQLTAIALEIKRFELYLQQQCQRLVEKAELKEQEMLDELSSIKHVSSD